MEKETKKKKNAKMKVERIKSQKIIRSESPALQSEKSRVLFLLTIILTVVQILTTVKIISI